MKPFLDWLKEEALPGVWSKGVQASRASKSIERVHASPDSSEIRLKMLTPERALAFEITLWPEEQDAHCNCDSKAEPCHHIVAAALALAGGTASDSTGCASEGNLPALSYRWRYQPAEDGKPARMRFQRTLLEKGEPRSLPTSLVSWVSGVRSGRIPGPLPSLTSLDLQIDAIYSAENPSWPELLPLLSRLPPLPVEGHPRLAEVQARAAPEPPVIRIRRSGPDRIRVETTADDPREILQQGLWIREGVLGHGGSAAPFASRVVEARDWEAFLRNELPRLHEEYEVIIEPGALPERIEREPQLGLRVTPLTNDRFSVTAFADYGMPPESTPAGGILVRNPEAERKLARAAREQFHLGWNEPSNLSAADLLQLQRTRPAGFESRELESVLRDHLARETGLSPERALRDEEVLRLLRMKEQRPENAPRISALLRALGEGTAETGGRGVELAMAPEVQGRLRDYQRQGCAWLQRRARELGGAILADDMGLGKTLQTLALLEAPALLVVPASLLGNWESEAKRFRPNLRVNRYHGPARRWGSGEECVLTTYSILSQEAERFASVDWKIAVLDEAHVIRNPETRAALASTRLNAGFRLALTGTPIQNRKRDLFSLFQFVAPGLFSDESELTPRLTGPFLLRRTKEEVLPELPPKTRMEHAVELSPQERNLYEAVFQSARAEIVDRLQTADRGGPLAPLSLLEVLLRARQACNHEGLIDPARRSISSSKLERALELTHELLEAGHSVLLYSQWTGFLDLLEDRLRGPLAGAHPLFRLDGSTRDRAEVIGNFQESVAPAVFLLSLHAGGVGLNLVKATHVIFCEPWWNPQVELQAEDRIYRLGQEKPVTIHRLIATNTLEEGLRALQARKLELGEEALQARDFELLLGD